MDALAAAALAGLSVLSFLLVRRVRALLAEVCALTERVNELTARLDATDQDVAGVLGRSAVVERVLLEKGVADEEDLDAARRYEESAPDAAGNDELH